jgi:class 3 adenylate cyclase
MEGASRRLAAVLAADIVGYSRMMSANEDATLVRVKALFEQIVRPNVAGHRGRIIKTTGDGFLADFASAFDALNCAVTIQKALEAADEVEGEKIRLRMGLNIGEIIFDEGDIFGDGVNIAARLEGMANPGAICISGRAWEDLRKLPFEFEDLGEQHLKNIPEPVRAYSLDFRPGPRPQNKLGRRIISPKVTIGAAIAGAITLSLLIWSAQETPRQRLADHVSNIPCSWLRVAEHTVQNDQNRVRMVGVALTPVSVLGQEVQKWADDNGIPVERVITDTAPMQSAQCEWLEVIKQYGFSGSPRVSLVSISTLPGSALEDLTFTDLKIEMADLKKHFVWVIIHPDGKVAVIDEARSRSGLNVGPDQTATVSIGSRVPGWVGIILIDSEKPIPAELFEHGASLETLRRSAEAGKWTAELVWFSSASEQSVQIPTGRLGLPIQD